MFSQIKPCHAEWYWGTWPTPARENIFLYPALFIQFLQAETHAGTECPCEVAGAGLDICPHMVLAVEAGQVNLGSGQSYTNIRTCSVFTAPSLSCVGTTSCVATGVEHLYPGPVPGGRTVRVDDHCVDLQLLQAGGGFAPVE